VEQVGVVAAVRRYPVKSMLGEDLAAGEFDAGGLVGDRAYGLVDHESGKVVSVKRPKRWARMFELAASTGGRPAGGPVAVRFPDGAALDVGDPELSARLSTFFGRAVSVVDRPPAGATFDEVWLRDLKDGAEPYLGAPSRVEDGDEMVDGGSEMSTHGNLFNFGSVHVVTTSSTDALARAAPASRFDPHRFRPNVVVETRGDGFVETAWQGRTLAIGDARLAVTFTVPRCVMTTLAQGDLPADREVLRTITRENAVDVLGNGTPYPCVGVYADVATVGRITVGDPVYVN
jgi:MOSC domain-containing protein